MFDRIITVTLNPAIENILQFDEVCSFKDINTIVNEVNIAGGGGISLSRNLKSIQVDSVAVVVVGEENATRYTGYLEYENIDYRKITAKGSVRENMMLNFPNSVNMRAKRQGPLVVANCLNELESVIKGLYSDDQNVLIAFCGSLPPNLDKESYKNFILKHKAVNTKIYIDSKDLKYEDYTEIAPFLVKVNLQTMEFITDSKIKNENTLIKSVDHLSEHTENTIAFLGDKGVVFKNNDLFCKVILEMPTVVSATTQPPPIQVTNTLNASEDIYSAYIAMFISGMINSESTENNLTLAMSVISGMLHKSKGADQPTPTPNIIYLR